MATNLPPFLINYLLNRGLFSDRFSAQKDTQETPKEEQELTFEKVLQDILDGGLGTEDNTSATSATSAPSSTTSSTGQSGLGSIGGLFGSVEQALNDAFSFDLEQAAVDAVQDATGLDLSFQGLFGIEAPSFISDIQRASPSTVTSAIMSSPHQSLGAKIGAGLHQGLMALAPFGITAFGMGMNMAGATDPFDPATDIAFDYDVLSGVSTISPDPETLGDLEPDVTRSEMGFAADIADLAAEFGLDATVSRGVGATVADYVSDIGQLGSLNFGQTFGAVPDFADFGRNQFSTIDALTNTAVGSLGLDTGGWGLGAYSAQPDPTSAFGYYTDYHSPEFDPANSPGPVGFDLDASLTSTDLGSLQASASESVDSDDGTGGFGVGDADDGAGGGLGY